MGYLINYLKVDCYDRAILWYFNLYSLSIKNFFNIIIKFVIKSIFSLFDLKIIFIALFLEIVIGYIFIPIYNFINKRLVWQYEGFLKHNIEDFLNFLDFVLLNYYNEYLSNVWFYNYQKNTCYIKFYFLNKFISFLKNKKDYFEIKYDSKYLNCIHELYSFK